MELNQRQKEAIEHLNGPILIVAGAGSGKTRTLTERLTRLLQSGVNPGHIVAVTFTNKAASEMRNRITHVGAPFIGTFHSLGAKILKSEATSQNRTGAFSIFDDDDSMSILKKTIKSLGFSYERCKPAVLASKISKIKNLLLLPEAILDARGLEVYAAYENALQRNNAFDFDDLIEKPVRLFMTKKEVLQKYHDRTQYILVDEYQDINRAQYELIRLLAEKHQNLSVVGDDAQAIYGWRYADFRNFLNFEKDWPRVRVVKLEQNYRSTGNIILAASALIKNNKIQKPKDLWTENPAGELISVARTHNEEEEAAWIVENIDGLVNAADQRSPEIAILYRTNAQSRALEQSLIQHNIAYKIFGGLKFYERKEIKDVVAGLRLAQNQRDEVSAERIEKNFPKQVATKLMRGLPELGRTSSILELINFFIETGGYFDYLERTFQNYAERIENINELIVFASEFKTLGEFLERVALLQATDAPAKTQLTGGYAKNPVALMTIHMAKGLEFDAVFVSGVAEGLLPHQMSYNTKEGLEEERRLMYVAMTRARKKLFLSFVKMPSQFLYEIPPELTEFTDLAGSLEALADDDNIIYMD